MKYRAITISGQKPLKRLFYYPPSLMRSMLTNMSKTSDKGSCLSQKITNLSKNTAYL